MQVWTVALLVGLLHSGWAQAQVFKCIENGRVIYSERQVCAEAPPARAGGDHDDPLPPDGVDMAVEIQAEFERERAEQEEARRLEVAAELERKAEEAARLQAEAARKVKEEKLLEARRAGPVTMAQYRQIQEYMTYQEVVYVLGKPGMEVARNDIAGYESVMYQWSNRDGSNMNAMFQNDRLVSKAQFGLR